MTNSTTTNESKPLRYTRDLRSVVDSNGKYLCVVPLKDEDHPQPGELQECWGKADWIADALNERTSLLAEKEKLQRQIEQLTQRIQSRYSFLVTRVEQLTQERDAARTALRSIYELTTRELSEPDEGARASALVRICTIVEEVGAALAGTSSAPAPKCNNDE